MSAVMARADMKDRYSGSVLIADKDGRVLFETAYGVADDSVNELFSLDTAVDIGSNAKAYAAAAIVALQRDGKLLLNDSIAKHLPGVPPDKKSITIHQLLTHTAGFPDEYAQPYEQITRETMEKKILEQPLLFQPGSSYAYSDMGYALTDALIERISGVPFKTFIDRTLFMPFELNHTDFLDAPIWSYNGGDYPVARGYTNGEERDSPVNLPKRGWTPRGLALVWLWLVDHCITKSRDDPRAFRRHRLAQLLFSVPCRS